MKKIINIVFFTISFITYLNAQTQIRIKENAHEGGVTLLCLGNNGETIITAGEDLKTYVWNLNTGEKSKGALKHTDKVTALAISANSKLYVSYSEGSCKINDGYNLHYKYFTKTYKKTRKT